MRESLELFRTVDGLRLGELPLVGASWERQVREGRMTDPPQGAGAQSLSSFTFTLTALESKGWIDRSQHDWQSRLLSTLMPKKHGIMYLYDGVPIVGGPIQDTVTITSDGVRVGVDGWSAITARRMVVPENFASDTQIQWSGVSLGTIAKKVMQHVTSMQNGGLPITYGQDEPADRVRTYPSHNVANSDAASRLENISNVINGPDIDFRPYILDQQRFAWRMVTGTETDPWIGQDTVTDWEVGGPDVEDLEADLSAAFIAHRVYAVGDGQDIGTHVTRVEGEVPPEWPLLEAVVSDSSITAEGDEDKSKLNAVAEAHLLSFPVIQLRMKVRADGSNPLGTYWPGEVARVTVNQHPALSDGTYDLRILSMSGSVGSRSVELVFDPLILPNY